MSTVLYRIGKMAFTHYWWAIAGWAAALVAIGSALVVSPPSLSSEIRIDGTAAQDVIDDLGVELPEASGGQGLIVFRAAEGGSFTDGSADQQALLSAVEEIYSTKHVIDAREVLAAEAAKGTDSPLLAASTLIAQRQGENGTEAAATTQAPLPLTVDRQQVPGVLVSADGSAALFQFQFDAQTFDLPSGTVEDLVEATEHAVDGSAVEVLPSQAMLQIPELVGIAEVIGVVIAALVLIATLGSVIAAGLPLLTALSGVGIGVGGAFVLSHVFSIHSLAAVLALMLGLAVGIDYALFIVNRQRRMILDQHLNAREAAARAIGTAGSAVFFAGLTVVIALLALSVVNVKILTTMAIVAAATVLIAVTCALTLLPALLGVVGERICSPKAREQAHTGHESGSTHHTARAWSGLLIRHRWIVAIVAVVAGGVLAVPALSMELGLPSGASYNNDTAERQSYELVADAFGDGYNGPLVVVATSPDGEAMTPATIDALHADLSEIDDVAQVSLGGVNDDTTTAVFSLVPTTGPTDAATADLVKVIRDQTSALEQAYGTEIGVTGFAALGIDVSERLSEVLPVYIAIVVGLSLLVLLLVFRSIIVPIKATIGFLISIGATLGATTALFQWGWLQQLLGLDATGPILSLLPIVMVGVLYGLAMDYEVFLVSSMKESHVHGHHGDDAITHGFAQASRVVVAAAIIMTAVFAGFAFNPDPMIKQVGFALAFGVLIDAFLVRLTLVPAVMSLLGDRAWWLPRWLDRTLPDLDVEGDKLTRQLEGNHGTPRP